MTCGEAVPRTLVSVSSRPGVFAGMPGLDGGVTGLGRVTFLLRLTKTVLIERPSSGACRPSRRALAEVRDLRAVDLLGLVAVELRLRRDALADRAMSANGLKFEPACMIASVAELSWRSGVVRAAVHRDDGAVAGLDGGEPGLAPPWAGTSGSAATAASWAFLSSS